MRNDYEKRRLLRLGVPRREMQQNLQCSVVGREEESRRLIAKIRKRESLLIWGPADAGKTALAKTVISRLPERDSRRCIYWAGTASVRQLVGELVRLLYLADDPIVRKKVCEDGDEASLDGWLREQTSGRLKLLLYAAAQKTDYWFFLDHLSPATHSMAGLMKEIIWRCKTPVYLLARGCSHAEVGHAWSIYYTPEYHIRLAPLTESAAHELLEESIKRFGLASLDLRDFRAEVLRLSGHLPGSITKMCELATDPRYHFEDRIKIRLVHVDYLMRTTAAHSQLLQGYAS